MMRLRIGIALIAVLALGCSAKRLPTETPLSVSPLQFQSGEVRQPDQVIVITDASGTMYEHATFPRAKALTQTFIAAMPEANAPAARPGGYSAGLISFGGDERIGAGLAPFNRASLASTAATYRVLGELGGYGGGTPYGSVLAESRAQLAGKSPQSALVIFSDGIPDSEDRAMTAAKALIAAYNGSVCIHTVQTGDDPAGAAFLDRLSKLTGCGSARTAASIHDSGAFMQFTRKVFSDKGRRAAPRVDSCGGVIRLRGVDFEFDSAELKGASSVVLDVAIDSLEGCPNIPVRVEGHTDSIGADDYNQRLGLRRAQAVRQYFVNGGISTGRISAKSFGESKPIAPNDTDEGRALNRRVEVHAEQ
jgi:OOP family OmpA-OmpF porin